LASRTQSSRSETREGCPAEAFGEGGLASKNWRELSVATFCMIYLSNSRARSDPHSRGMILPE
jgi:hypothetical protein